MSRLVDAALSEAPASISHVHSSSAAPASTTAASALPCSGSSTLLLGASSSNAEVQPVTDAHEPQAGTLPQQLATSAAAQPRLSKDAIAESSECLGSSASARSVGSKKAHRPAWALTADAAQDAEQQEEEDLLAFAGGLEFDKYINEQEDAELRTALQVLAQLPLNGSQTSMLLKQIMGSCAEQAVVLCVSQALPILLSAGQTAAVNS